MTKNKNILGRGVSYLIAAVGALVILLPFYVTVITAFKTPEQSAKNFFSFRPDYTWIISSQYLRKPDILNIL